MSVKFFGYFFCCFVYSFLSNSISSLYQRPSTLFALVPYSACSMSFVAYVFSPTGSGHARSKPFPFLIDVSMLPPPSSFVLSNDIVSRRYSQNRPPSFPSPQSKLACSAFSASLVPSKVSLRTVFSLPNPFPVLFASYSAFSSFFTSNLPIFQGNQLAVWVIP